MRVVFMGTPEFAVPSLRALVARHDVVAVYTRPDAVSGRGSATRPSPVKVAAQELGLPVVQPRTLRDESAQAQFAQLAPDVCVVAAYGLILPREVLEVPRLGCVNVHASLLPRWRGAAPVQRAILAGDASTGVAIMRMEEGLDTGPYCVVETVAIADKTAPALTAELAQSGARALMHALDGIENGSCTWTEQDDNAVTYATKLEKADVALSPDLAVSEALRRVRASGPQAPARLAIAGHGVTIIDARAATDRPVSAGSVSCTKNELLLGFADGALAALRVKPDGKREMPGCDWARGLRLAGDEIWEALQ